MTPRHTVEKIGGTSMSATDVVLNDVIIRHRHEAELYNRIFVVSAYSGMTDLLLEHKKTGEAGVYARFVADEPNERWEDGLEKVADAMRAKNKDLFDTRLRHDADAFVDDRIKAMLLCLQDVDRLRSYGHFCLAEPLTTIREMLASLGEAHSAYTLALLLRDRGIDAAFVDLTGWQENAPSTLEARIEAAFSTIDLSRTLPIVTGYARCEGGMVRRYARGYSEMTFSRLAVQTAAREAIIHKEFHLSSADPKLVGPDKARKIGRTNYDVADQLANLGMEAIHPLAGRGMRQAGIPLRVRNTFDSADEGTLIEDAYCSETPRVEIVTGVRQLFALQVFAQDMVGEKGYDATILDVLTRHNAWIVSKSSNANTITHYLSVTAATMRKLIADLEGKYPEAAISGHSVAMVSAIGSDLSEPGFVASAMRALAEASIPVLGMQHQIRNVDIQFIVDQSDFDRAILALHDALIVGNDTPVAEPALTRAA